MKFRKVDTRIWGDEKFRVFTDDGKLGFLFLLTHPALTALGVMRGTLNGLAAELGWPVKRLRAALAPALAQGMVEINESASFIALPNFMKFNRPENPNVAKAWVSALDLIPECSEKPALIARCRDSLSGTCRQGFEEAFTEAFGGEPFPKPFAKPFTEPFTEPFPKGMPNPEPEPEPEQRTGTGGEASSPPPSQAQAQVQAKSNGARPPSRKHVNDAWQDRQPVKAERV